MKTMIINPKSLHYRLASVYGSLDPHKSITSSCAYPWHVIWGVFITILIAVFSTILICIMASPIWFVVMGWLYGFIEPISVSAIAGAVFWIVIIVGCIVFWYTEYILPALEAKRKVHHIPKHSALYYFWQSFKDKTCIKIAIDGVGPETDRIPHTYWIKLNDGTGFRVTYPAGEPLLDNIRRHSQYIFDETLDKDIIGEWHTQDMRRVQDQDSVRYAPFITWYKANDIEFEDE